MLRARLLFAIALLSFSLIAFQIFLMQILSIVQWYHFAYMVISVALLGFGASGTFLAIARERVSRHFDWLVPFFMMVSGCAISTAVWFSQTVIGGFDSYLLFVEGGHRWRLVLTYLIYLVPFFFGAAAIGLVFMRQIEKVGVAYMANLMGSGAGAAGAVLCMWLTTPEQLPALVGGIAIIGGIIVLSDTKRVVFVGIASLTLLIALYSFINPPTLQPSQYKSLSRTLLLPEARVVARASSPYGLIEVVHSPALRFAPGLSLTYQDTIPVREAMFNNGDWFGPLIGLARDGERHLMSYTTIALPYAISPRQNVLLINAGTGVGVSHALAEGARNVVAVEPHAAAISLLRGKFASSVDSLFDNKSLTTRTLEPRTALALNTHTYDLIALPILDAFGGTAGAFSLQEQYYLTKEAFMQMWDHLAPDGVISVSSWIDYPLKYPLRILATLVETLEDAGIDDPSAHLAAVRSWGTITFVLKRTPLTAEELHAVREFSKDLLFDPAILPGLQDDERSRYNALQDDKLFSYFDEILHGERVRLYREYDFNIEPTSDNRPYFSQFLRWKSLPYLTEMFGMQTAAFLEIGYLIVAITFAQLLAAAAALILLPLVKWGWKKRRSENETPTDLRRSRMRTILYFSGIGLGYMFVEIVFIQRFVLYLGNPIYAVAFVIAAMLMSSGVGSLLSSRFLTDGKILRRTAAIVALTVIAYGFALTPVLSATLTLPPFLKLFFAFGLVALPAFVMGFPFPLGLRQLGKGQQEWIPWAWGINGSVSVVSTALATIIAVEAGYATVMLGAACGYVVAATVAGR